MAQYVSISLNMPKYPWKWLNKLFWLCQSSEYACSFYMYSKLLKMPETFEDVLNKPGFWIWQGCACKGYAEFRICLIIAPYASVTPEYALMSFNMSEHGWIFLNAPESMNIPEYFCINCSDYASVRVRFNF